MSAKLNHIKSLINKVVDSNPYGITSKSKVSVSKEGSILIKTRFTIIDLPYDDAIDFIKEYLK